jgi:hypothetical protein
MCGFLCSICCSIFFDCDDSEDIANDGIELPQADPAATAERLNAETAMNMGQQYQATQINQQYTNMITGTSTVGPIRMMQGVV